MNCIHHPERSAVDTCAGCGGGVCEFCKTLVEGKVYCPPCVDKMVAAPGAAGISPQATPVAPVGSSSASDPFAIMNMKPPSAGQPAPSSLGRMEQPALVSEGGGSSLAGVIWMLVVAACGGLALGGVFMPWVRFKEWIFTISISGWQATQWDQYVGATLIEPYLVLVGAAIMVMCALPALVLALTSAESEDTVRHMDHHRYDDGGYGRLYLLRRVDHSGGSDSGAGGFGADVAGRRAEPVLPQRVIADSTCFDCVNLPIK